MKMKQAVAAAVAVGLLIAACGSDTDGPDDESAADTADEVGSEDDDATEDDGADEEGDVADGDYDPHGHLDFSAVSESDYPAAAVERGFFQLDEWHDLFPEDRDLMDSVNASLSADPEPITVDLDGPVRIAMMFPSLETSDAFGRLNLSIRGHLDALEIPFEITEFLIQAGEHDTQSGQVEQVLANAEDYDYVIIGPSEYLVQKSNIERLVAELPTLVMNVVNPMVDWPGTANLPLTHVAFDHVEGALLLCEWAIDYTGGEGEFALIRYLTGLIDEGRSDTFADCLEENSNMVLVDEYPGEGDTELSFTGANAVISANPNIRLLHNGSTANTLGTLAALEERRLLDEVVTNGWGGGGDELEAILNGNLEFTVFRVNDDWGAATAEVIKMHLEGRPVPVNIAGTMEIIDQSFSEEDIVGLTDYAFRYSGVLER